MSAVAEILKICVICQENIQDQPVRKEETETILKCQHVFHIECIQKWFEYKHHCPVCRDPQLDILTPEAPLPEMTQAEILAVPDFFAVSQDVGLLITIRNEMAQIRRVERLNLQEDTPVARTAAKVNSIAMAIFRF